MKYEIVRGIAQIGGSIIEVSHNGTRILLDCGALLQEIGAEQTKDPFDVATLGAPDAVFLSHHHGDHSGLIDELPNSVPVYASEGTIAVLRAVGEFIGKPTRPFIPIQNGLPVQAGELRVTGIPVEHSAHDAMMLLVEGGGERLLYTGDFKRIPDSLGAFLKEPVDTLITEGTMLDREAGEYPNESAVLKELEGVLQSTRGHLFVLQSTANVGRMRSVLAARNAVCPDRPILHDIFAKYLLESIGEGELINKYAFMAFYMEENKATSCVARYFDELSQKRKLSSCSSLLKLKDAIILIRPIMLPMLKSLRERGLQFDKSALVFSMWKGHEGAPKFAELLSFFASEGVAPKYIHTSGHAEEGEVRRLVAMVNARRTILVHSDLERLDAPNALIAQ